MCIFSEYQMAKIVKNRMKTNFMRQIISAGYAFSVLAS